jgi:hypothetical protein
VTPPNRAKKIQISSFETRTKQPCCLIVKTKPVKILEMILFVHTSTVQAGKQNMAMEMLASMGPLLVVADVTTSRYRSSLLWPPLEPSAPCAGSRDCSFCTIFAKAPSVLAGHDLYHINRMHSKKNRSYSL